MREHQNFLSEKTTGSLNERALDFLERHQIFKRENTIYIYIYIFNKRTTRFLNDRMIGTLNERATRVLNEKAIRILEGNQLL